MDAESIASANSKNIPTHLTFSDDSSVPVVPRTNDNERQFTSNNSVTSIRSESRAYVQQPRTPRSAASMRSARARSDGNPTPALESNNNTNTNPAENDFSVGLYCLAVLRNKEDDNVTSYKGTCHCKAIKFEMLAPKELVIKTSNDGDAAKDKIHYRYTIIKTTHFEISQGQDSLTTYYVETAPKTRYYIRKAQGARAFCKRCGVHILYAPSKNSPFMHINVNCFPNISSSLPSPPLPLTSSATDITTRDSSDNILLQILQAGQTRTTDMVNSLRGAASQFQEFIVLPLLGSLRTWNTPKGE
jgi:hypothetical protein